MLRWAVCGIAALLLATGAAAAVPRSPTEVINKTVDEVFQILSDEQLKQPGQSASRRKLLEGVIGKCFDYEEMSKRTLAVQWKKLNEGEKKEFVEVFRAFLSDRYADKIEAYSGEQVHYIRERLKDGYAEVRTKIVSPKVELPIDYRLLRKADKWFVYDVLIEGVSLVRNYRSQFHRIIRSSSYEDLLEKLRRRVEDVNTS